MNGRGWSTPQVVTLVAILFSALLSVLLLHRDSRLHARFDLLEAQVREVKDTVARRPIVEVVVGIAPTVADYVGREVDEAVHAAELAGHVVEVLAPRPAAGDGPRRSGRDGAGPPDEHPVVADQEPPAGERSRVLLLHVRRTDDPNPTGG